MRLAKYLISAKWLLLAALMINIISNLLALIGPRLSGSAIDAMTGGRTIVKCGEKDAAAIEDSFNGVRSAKAAGLYTIMVPDIVQPDDEIRALADQVFPSLKEVLESIEKD